MVFRVLAFVAWVVDPAKGQALIRDFGKEKFGAPLFFPNSTEYRKASGLPAGNF
jgi:tungstate transport system substrate-binding protein